MPVLWKITLVAMAIAVAIYAGGIFWLYQKQRTLLYPAPTGSASIAAPASGSHEVHLATADGLHLRAIYRPARAGRATIVFFHGNGDSLAGSQQATRQFADHGYGLLLPEYRGYGGNAGSPSEEGLYLDGEASLRWLAEQGIAPERTIVIGNSLDSGVASELAARHRLGALVLVSAFTSMVDTVQRHYRFVPVRRLLLDRYENHRKLSRVTAPVLILHGSADTLVPVGHASALARAAENATLGIFPGAGHDLAYALAPQARAIAWLRGLGH
jgi:uncharacterized protein